MSQRLQSQQQQHEWQHARARTAERRHYHQHRVNLISDRRAVDYQYPAVEREPQDKGRRPLHQGTHVNPRPEQVQAHPLIAPVSHLNARSST